MKYTVWIKYKIWVQQDVGGTYIDHSKIMEVIDLLSLNEKYNITDIRVLEIKKS